MPRGNNKYGAAGKGGVPASTVVAFLDHYTYEGFNPEQIRVGQLAPADVDRAKRINGKRISPVMARTIRRWRHEDVHVSARGLAHVLDEFGFDLPWFHGWAKLHRKPLT